MLNPNYHDYKGDFTLYKSAVVVPTTSWKTKAAGVWTEVNNWEGVDIRVRVDNNMVFGGDDRDLDVDRVTARHVP